MYNKTHVSYSNIKCIMGTKHLTNQIQKSSYENMNKFGLVRVHQYHTYRF